MRVLLYLGLVLAAAVAAEHDYITGSKVYEVTPDNQQQVDILRSLVLQNGFDFWEHPSAVGSPVTVMVEQHTQFDFVKMLLREHIVFKIAVEDMEEYLRNERVERGQRREAGSRVNGTITFDQYYRHDEMNDYLDELATEFPDLVTVETLGDSYEGRVMKLIRISTGGGVGGGAKPAMFIDAGIHAREWIAPAVALYVIHELVENAQDHPDLLESVDWIVLPLVNPDGYEYTHETNRLWRKTRSPTSNPNCMGVDGNRNFDFHWNEEQGSSPDPCSLSYAGAKAFSEVETVLVRNVLNRQSYNIHAFLTLHSYGNLFMYPWGYTLELPEDGKELQALGDSVAKAIRDVRGSVYTVGSASNTLYMTSGTSRDYAKGVPKIKYVYTMELPRGGASGFELPPSQILDVVLETFEGIRVIAKKLSDSQTLSD